ncbi:hypothetical protein B0920_17490 [Massilia sp. KIM]|uniref:GtrA family protein n=1 Tax=Massilia sp. KIM TaxID=1955422 RepID=UPI00098F78F5|nr:GtrA family protein [Massilia sp. KIM]OON60749.1 hypothetical protein B0920_17490 [Massilia sp. KIM]
MADSRPDWQRFAVFVAGGGLSALVDIGLMQLLLGAGAHYGAAASAGFGAGLMVNYLFHSKLTFGARSNVQVVARYLCVTGLNYLLTLACVAAGAALLASPLAGKLVSLPLVAVNGYLLSKHWIFKP